MLNLLLAAAAATAPVANDYGLGQNWLCRPDRRDACTTKLDSTDVAADGSLTPRSFAAARAAKADCFYVYPTVSYDATPNSDMIANDEERGVIALQFARFAEQCRLFAPLYRQVTLTALRAALIGQPVAADRELNYADVRDAWRHYLANDNQGRPFVLIGHSQGSGLLKRLVAEEIDGKAVQRQMLSAMLTGTNITVAKGKDIGGDFKTVPLCRSARQTGCVISYVSFRETAPPPEKSRFGRIDRATEDVACTNPAALGGGVAVLSGYYTTGNYTDIGRPGPPWVRSDTTIATRFVRVPGLVSGGCVSKDGANYLAVRINAIPADPRADDIGGDIVFDTQIATDWGLHLIDVNLVQGDLIALVASQAAAWEKAGQ